MISEQLTEKLETLPTGSGVYMFLDIEGRVLYVGKAKNLRSRVRSYFRDGGDGRPKIRFLQARMADLEIILTSTEKEALILENNLIKEHSPRFNVRLRDQKTYLGLRLNLEEAFPRLIPVRRPRPGKALYFGPYTSSRAMRETLSLLGRIFPLRTCSDEVMTHYRRLGRPCLEYEMKRCCAPCCDYVDQKEYRALVRSVSLFLRGKADRVVSDLTSKMKQASDQLDYERAAVYRDRITAVQRTVEKQRVVSEKQLDRDVFGFFRERTVMQVDVLHVRKGKLLGVGEHLLRGLKLGDEDVFSQFFARYYGSDRFIPSRILLPLDLEGLDAFSEYLSEKAERVVSISVPRRGGDKSLIEMATRNAESTFRRELETRSSKERLLDALQSRLRLRWRPDRIECFDISNISGDLAVGSMVTFEGGTAVRNRYRRYRIREKKTPDDYGMMREVLQRRLARAVREGDFPDLLLVDGGVGQLNVARSVLREMGLEPGVNGPELAGLAKDRGRKGQGSESKGERVYRPLVKGPIRFRNDSPALFLLQRIRDESHRFAVTYHKSLRRKRNLHSVLEEIPGIGPAKRNALLRHFGSLKKLRQASEDEIREVKGVSSADAHTLHSYFAAMEERSKEP